MSRLEEIKERYMEHEYDYALSAMDIDWLIKQAERVEKLEKENKLLRFIAEENKIAYEQRAKQNKRYREALEKISAPIYKVTYADMVAVKRIARQAFEGDEN